MSRFIAIVCCAALVAGCATASGGREAAPDFPAASPAPRGYGTGVGYGLAFVFGGLRITDLDGPRELPAGVREQRDVVYASLGGFDLHLDIYRPEPDPGTAVPGILFVHGGSWKRGNKRDVRAWAVRYAERGYVTASVQYRLSGQAVFPAALDDVRAALRYLRARADELGMRSDAVAVVGYSAGGHLALLAAYSPEAVGPDSVAAVVDFYGPTDLTIPLVAAHPAVRGLIGKSRRSSPDRYVAASPVRQVRAGLPPTLIFHGTIDSTVPVGQSEALFAGLAAAGVEAYYDPIQGWPHAMDTDERVFRHCAEVMDVFLARVFGRV